MGVEPKEIELWVSYGETFVHNGFNELRRKERAEEAAKKRTIKMSPLIQALDFIDQESGELIMEALPPKLPGIYVWYHRFTPSQSSSEDLMAWIDRALRLPIARVSGNFGHFGRAVIELGASRLDSGPNSSKRRALLEFFANDTLREEFTTLLQDFDSSMVLYVGQTEDLNRRTREHLGNGGLVEKFRALDWELGELSMRFIVLPDTETALREAIERILSVLLLAPLVDRAG